MSDAVWIAVIVAIPPTIAAIVAAWISLQHVKTLRDDRLNALERKVNIIFARQLESKSITAEDIQRFFGTP